MASEINRINFYQSILAVICVVVALFGIKQIGNYGAASFLVSKAEKNNSPDLADFALSLFSESADLHKGRGRIFLNLEQPDKAVPEFEQSLKIRPDDYSTWFQLGFAREEINDIPGAIKAYQQTSRLAPFYGLPKWYLGQLYYKSGQQEEGWKEMRAAYHNNPDLLLIAIRFAWGETRGNTDLVEKLLELTDPNHKLILGLFLLEQGDTLDAASYLCNSTELPESSRRTLVSKLFNKKEFRLAFLVETGRCISKNDWPSFSGTIRNKSFESDIQSNNNSFDWQVVSDEKNIQIIRDNARYFEGVFSLGINFNGDVKTGQGILKQLVLVEPNSRYQLSYKTQAKDLLTDSYPQLIITDASKEDRILIISDGFNGAGADHWKVNQLEFDTSEDTGAVWISIQRPNCRYSKCPILGSIWIDDLNLQKIKAN